MNMNRTFDSSWNLTLFVLGFLDYYCTDFVWMKRAEIMIFACFVELD